MPNLNASLTVLPGWITAMAVVIGGWLTAGAARFFFSRLLTLLHFNPLCERIGVGDFLRKGEVARTPAQLVGGGLYWVILIATVLKATCLLDIAVVTDMRRRALATMPGLLSAVLVLGMGLVVTGFVSGFIRTVTRNAGSPYANLWARLSRWIGGILALAIACEQAEIGGTILAGVVQIVVAAVAFGMALAFGLGCKDMIRDSMERLIADVKERHRDTSRPDMED